MFNSLEDWLHYQDVPKKDRYEHLTTRPRHVEISPSGVPGKESVWLLPTQGGRRITHARGWEINGHGKTIEEAQTDLLAKLRANFASRDELAEYALKQKYP